MKHRALLISPKSQQTASQQVAAVPINWDALETVDLYGDNVGEGSSRPRKRARRSPSVEEVSQIDFERGIEAAFQGVRKDTQEPSEMAFGHDILGASTSGEELPAGEVSQIDFEGGVGAAFQGVMRDTQELDKAF
jgi:hypothetical protein